MTSASGSLLITGYGYTGARLARRLHSAGRKVCILARDASQVTQARALGCLAEQVDLDDHNSDPTGGTSGEVLVHLVPPPGHGRRDSRLRGLLKRLAPATRVILISTTGVYGDHAGAVVTERSVTNPTTDRAVRRADAESAVEAYGAEHDVPVHVLRVPSIYGPGRLPIERLKRRDPLPPAGDCPFTNRIHVDDLVTTIVAMCESASAGPLYNISDGVPLTSRAWRETVADVVGLPYPPEISREEAEAQLPEKTLSFLRESRLIDSNLIRADLGLQLSFDNPIEGIRNALAMDEGS